MLAVPTTTVSVLRGTTVDAYLDTVDNAAVAASGVPASLLEQTRTFTREADRRPQTVRFTSCRLPGTTKVQPGDLLKDEKTGVVYALDTSVQLSNIASKTDLRLALRRVT